MRYFHQKINIWRLTLFFLCASIASWLIHGWIFDQASSSGESIVTEGVDEESYQVARAYFPPNRNLDSASIVLPLQLALEDFLTQNKASVAAVIIVSVKTGEVLAAAELGLSVLRHDISTYALFPAASLFKIATSVSAYEKDLALTRPSGPKMGLFRDCDDRYALSGERRTYPSEAIRQKVELDVSFDEAFASSCNGFFSLLAAEYLSTEEILKAANDLGWHAANIDSRIQKALTTSPVSSVTPPPNEDVSYRVQLAIGLGPVFMSPLHAAWLATVIASGGLPRELSFTRKTKAETAHLATREAPPVMTEKTALWLRSLMKNVVLSGTASADFASKRYDHLRAGTGGKTGTRLFPETRNNASWFLGYYGTDDVAPEIAVAAVTTIKKSGDMTGAKLAAEAIFEYIKTGAEQINARRRQEPIKE